jgi:sorbitol-specific phosphotransferase system component IIA
MKVSVYDTYVRRRNGTVMQFDIIVPADLKDTSMIFNYGKDFLKTKGEDGQTLSTKECQFCHIEEVKPQWEKTIKEKGYYIYEVENCN